MRVVPGTPFGLEVKEEYADQAVRTLRRTGHMKAWRRERMPRRFHYGTHPTRLTNVIVIPETGWTLDYAPQERPVRKRGTHGFDNRDRLQTNEQHVVCQPGFGWPLGDRHILAALWPGAPVTPPPGCVPAPHRYRPLSGPR